MRLPFLRPKAPAPERARARPAAGAPASEEAARTHARRRLAGAVLLLAAGVIGFPLLFETQPRPLPVDTPIELRPLEPGATAALLATPRKAPPVTAPPADAGQEVERAAPAAPVEAASLAAPAPPPAASVPAAAASAPGPLRYVVQAGAYTDAAALRSARQKIEKLGLESYTQVIESGGARRTRVRVGPLGTRAEADAVAAKVRAAGLPTSVLAL